MPYFTISEFTVLPGSTPDAPKTWFAFLTHENFNQTQTHDNDDLRKRLRDVGKSAIVRHMAIRYTAAAGGSVVRPIIATSNAAECMLEDMLVTVIDGVANLDWPGLFIPMPLIFASTYTVAVLVVGYGATDDMLVMVSGEVW